MHGKRRVRPLRYELRLLLLLLQHVVRFPARVSVEQEVPQRLHPAHALAAGAVWQCLVFSRGLFCQLDMVKKQA